MSTDDRTFSRRKNRFTEEKETNTKNNTLEDGRPWWRIKVGKRWAVSSAGRKGAWVPVNWDWKGHLWLCRRGSLKGQWWFGSGQ